jgi:Ca2+-binding EF-hand superfamily protein
MKTKFFALTLAAALSCGSLPLLAQDAPPPPPSPGGEGRPPGGPPQGGPDRVGEFIKKADSDSDGKLSKDEFVGSTKKEAEDRFSKIDSNSDGFIEKSEAEEMARRVRDMQRPEGMRRAEGGGDRDGGVRPRPAGENKEGAPPAPGPDGRRPEGFRPPDGEGGPRPEGFRRPEGEGGSPGLRQGGPGAIGGMNFMADRLRRMDKNEDKIISKDEFLASSEEQFAQMDENKDGKITTEEIEAMGRRMREMMGGGGRGGEGGFRRPGGEGGREGGVRPRPEGEGERPRRPEGEAAPAPAPQN